MTEASIEVSGGVNKFGQPFHGRMRQTQRHADIYVNRLGLWRVEQSRNSQALLKGINLNLTGESGEGDHFGSRHLAPRMPRPPPRMISQQCREESCNRGSSRRTPVHAPSPEPQSRDQSTIVAPPTNYHPPPTHRHQCDDSSPTIIVPSNAQSSRDGILCSQILI